MMMTLDAIQQWERLGEQLEAAIATYSNACTVLESSASGDLAGAYSLVPRIDRLLDSFSTSFSQRLTSAHSSIVRTRNNIVSPAHRLPNEILSKIFHFTINSIDVKEISQLSCEYTIRITYQRPHALSGVCSVWRRVGLKEGFWSLVPIIEHLSGRYMSTAAQTSLEKAYNHRLSLAAYLKDSRPDIQDFVTTMFSQHGHRFDSINLHSNSLAFLVRSIEALVGSVSNEQGSVKDLSLYYSTSTDRQLPNQSALLRGWIFLADPARRLEFERLVESLRVLHICGLMVPIGGTSLRNMTRLTLQAIRLETNLVFASCLRALASSSQLRTLEVISVSVEVWSTEEDSLKGFPIFFPNLQNLYMEDMYGSMFQLTLRSISPGSHKVSINWSGLELDEWRNISHFPTEMRMRDFKVDALYISGQRRFSFMGTNKIRPALEALPTITALYLDSFVIDLNILEDVLMPTIAPHGEQDINPNNFPKLRTLHISRSHCHDPKVLHHLLKVAADHTLEELGIGIDTKCSCVPVQPSQDDFDFEMEFVWRLLTDAVPCLRRLPIRASEISDVAFESCVWQLRRFD